MVVCENHGSVEDGLTDPHANSSAQEPPPDALICPKCNRILEAGEELCPLDHSVTGGVRGVNRSALQRTPRAKRHMLGVTINNTYIINGYLGSGGFGAVYRAEQKPLGRDIALKLLMLDSVGDEQVIHRFKREARTAAALLDPNIVPLFDYGETSLGQEEDDHLLYFAMELVYGPTLRRLLKVKKGLSLNACLKIGINVLRGLSAAHQLGVVHRDLKPGNVLLDESKNRKYFARLFDFGIASLQGSGGHTTQMGQGGILGTPKYMAPEQWRAQQTAPCTDIYAFGVIMAEMLLGEPPVPKMELVEMAAAHCRDPRPSITISAKGEPLPPALTNFVKKCMAIDPRQRYAIAGEALAVLESIDSRRDAAPIPTVSLFSPPGEHPDGDLSGDTQMPIDAEILSTVPAAPPIPPNLKSPPSLTLQKGLEPEEVLQVALEEPRRLWPWALALSVLILAAALFQIARGLSSRERPILRSAPALGLLAPDAQIPAQVDAALPKDAAVILDLSPPKDLLLKDVALPKDAAPIKVARPKPPRSKPKPRIRSKPKPKPKPPIAIPAHPDPRIPKSKVDPSDEELRQAERFYADGRDAERRGAPKSARSFYMRALRKGLKGKKAKDAQQRIKRIMDRLSLEASDF